MGLGSQVVQVYLQWNGAATTAIDAAGLKQTVFPATVIAKLSCLRFQRQMLIFPNSDNNIMIAPVSLTPPPSRTFRGNSIIAAHRDLHFRFLKDVRLGDEFKLQSRDGEYNFRVTKLSVVKISDRTLLRPSSESVLTLVTCYPFYYVGSAPQRFIVRAILIEDDERQSIAKSQ